MESYKKTEILLPSSLLNDIEFDQLDQKLESIDKLEKNGNANDEKYDTIIIYFNFLL
jgi:hypothetical protein